MGNSGRTPIESAAWIHYGILNERRIGEPFFYKVEY